MSAALSFLSSSKKFSLLCVQILEELAVFVLAVIFVLVLRHMSVWRIWVISAACNMSPPIHFISSVQCVPKLGLPCYILAGTLHYIKYVLTLVCSLFSHLHFRNCFKKSERFIELTKNTNVKKVNKINVISILVLTSYWFKTHSEKYRPFIV